MKPMHRLFILLAVLSVASLCAGQDMGWRVASRISQSSGWEYSPDAPEGITSFTDRVEETIYYSPDYYDVVDRIETRTRHTGANGDGEWHDLPTIICNPAVASDAYHRTVYYIITNGTWYKQRVETIDDMGRMAYLTITNGDMPATVGKRLHFIYDVYGRLESLVTASFDPTGVIFRKRDMQYDAMGRKTGELVSISEVDSTSWVPEKRVTLWQSGDSFPPGTSFKLNSVLFDINPPGYWGSYDLLSIPGLTETGIVDSVHTEEYIDGEWVHNYSDTYDIVVYPDGTVSYNIVSWYLPYMGAPDYGHSVWSFGIAPHGGFLGLDFSYDDGLSPPSWGGVSYVWEQVSSAEDPLIPSAGMSLSAYPNPFRDKLTLLSDSKGSGIAELKIYNLRGQLVRKLESPQKALDWDGTNSDGFAVPKGIYIIRYREGDQSATVKVLKY